MHKITIGESVDVMTLPRPAKVIGCFRKVNHHISTSPLFSILRRNKFFALRSYFFCRQNHLTVLKEVYKLKMDKM